METRSLALNLLNTIITIMWNLTRDERGHSFRDLLLLYLVVFNSAFTVYWLLSYFTYFQRKIRIWKSIFYTFLKKIKTNEINFTRDKSLNLSKSSKTIRISTKDRVIKKLNRDIKNLKLLVKLMKIELSLIEKSSMEKMIESNDFSSKILTNRYAEKKHEMNKPEFEKAAKPSGEDENVISPEFITEEKVTEIVIPPDNISLIGSSSMNFFILLKTDVEKLGESPSLLEDSSGFLI